MGERCQSIPQVRGVKGVPDRSGPPAGTWPGGRGRDPTPGGRQRRPTGEPGHRPVQLGLAGRTARHTGRGGGLRRGRGAVRCRGPPALHRAGPPRLGRLLRGLRRRSDHRGAGPGARAPRPPPAGDPAHRPAHAGPTPDPGLAGAVRAAVGPAGHAVPGRLRPGDLVQAGQRGRAPLATDSTSGWPSRTIPTTSPCSTPRASPASTSTPATTSRADCPTALAAGPASRAGAAGGHEPPSDRASAASASGGTSPKRT